MNLDYATLDALRRNHPGWRLLLADSAPLVASFLQRVFIAPNVRAMAQADLVEKLEDELFNLRQTLGPEAFPRAAAHYLDDWAADNRGWLRKFYPPGSDEPHFDLTPATEKALAWLASLTQRAFVGTESRLMTVFELLEQMVAGSETDPQERLRERLKRRQEIDDEIARISAGELPLLDDTALRDRFQQLAATARELLSDFREVEHNFRLLDRRVRERIARWEGAKGALLDEILGERDAIADSDQGRSFRAFWDFLMSQARQEELSSRLDRVMELPAVKALALIGKGREARRYQELLAMTRERCPSVLHWLAKRPLHAVNLAGDWSRLLAVVNWLQANPRPGVYLRQVDLPGVHTKFIEAHKGVLAELFDLALPAETIHSEAKGAGLFERRYGFREKPATVRFRLLDAAPALPRGLSDLALTDGEFARLDPGVSRVFITENEINFLAFPQASDSLVIFGAGYGFDPLRQAGWLYDKAIYYWGDIDTHGFAILDQLRAHFPEARSLLMDRDTLMAHREYWVTETRPTDRNLSRLTPAETALYDDLRSNRLGDAVRLEQEKIGFQRLLAVVI